MSARNCLNDQLAACSCIIWGVLQQACWMLLLLQPADRQLLAQQQQMLTWKQLAAQLSMHQPAVLLLLVSLQLLGLQ